MGTSFTPELRALVREGSQRSAAVVVPLFLRHYRPEYVVDVGCGEGWWGREFEAHDCKVLGIDHDVEPVIPFLDHDLTEPIPPERYDLAVSLEVAEHLPPERADSFIADLCSLAPVVLFSAAIPGQGGIGHLNEQWPAYWVERFEANGYECSGALRWEIWNDDRVENWYRQNLMVAARNPDHHLSLVGLFDSPLTPMWPVVHPVLYDARRHA